MRFFGGIFADYRKGDLARLEMFQTFTARNEFAIWREDGGNADNVAGGDPRVAQGQLEAGEPFAMFPDTFREKDLLRDESHGAGFSGLPDRIESKKNFSGNAKVTRNVFECQCISR